MTALKSILNQYLDSLESAEQELLAILLKRKEAVTHSRIEEFHSLGQAEKNASSRVQSLIPIREKILATARKQGIVGGSLAEIVARSSNDPDWQKIQNRIESLDQLGKRLRHESWVTWIITQRRHQFFTELVDVIAQGGQEALTYSTNTNPVRSTAALFDEQA